ESLSLENRRQIQIKNLNPFTSIVKILKPSPILGLIWIYFLLFLAGQVHPVNWTLYTQTKFGWSAFEVGLSLTFVGVMIGISQGVLTRILIPRLGEQRSLTIGIAIEAITFLLFGLVTSGWMMYPVMLFFSLSGIAMPALQSMAAKHVPDNEQGELQGSLVALGSLSSVIAPFIFTFLFVQFTRPDAQVYFPGAAYVGAAVICLFTLAFRIPRNGKTKSEPAG
ncbi:MAG: MFS transporter, partial [Spirochaetia bacterium]|nr:MFS transporter [Spirochaetia bacterium]